MYKTHHRTSPFRPHASNGYTAAQIAMLYSYPQAGPAPVEVAIMELGGGHQMSDIQRYCQMVGCPVPPITSVSVLGASNRPEGNANGPDGEVALDIQCVIGATGGRVPIRMYYAPNTGQGFAASIAAVAQEDRACALSISWGLREATWNRQDVQLMEQALVACRTKGISVFAASGDDGSSDGGPGNNTDYPASSPNLTGCGGTTVLPGGAERAWSYGGGGYSALFARPSWQGIPGNARGVPDIAGDADGSTGYITIVDGTQGVIGGTSAVAPMWAALVALLVSRNGGTRMGHVGEWLWKLGKRVTKDITTGNNGAFQAGTGWDACTGLGCPNGAEMLEALLGGGGTPPPPPPGPPPVQSGLQATLSVQGYRPVTVLLEKV